MIKKIINSNLKDFNPQQKACFAPWKSLHRMRTFFSLENGTEI